MVLAKHAIKQKCEAAAATEVSATLQ